MAIGRAEDRDNPWCPAMLRHHCHVWDPVRVTHLGQRPSVPHAKAGHMTAIEQTIPAAQPLRGGGRPHMGIGGALFLALRPQHQTTGSELYNTSNRMTPDGLANLPRDYTGLPKTTPQLGPPLPGDLGKPIANAGAPAPGMPTRMRSSSASLRSRKQRVPAISLRRPTSDRSFPRPTRRLPTGRRSCPHPPAQPI